MTAAVQFRELARNLAGNRKKVADFVIKHSPKDLTAQEFLAKNHSKRLSEKFAGIKKQPFSLCELEELLGQLRRHSQALSDDSAYSSFRASTNSSCSSDTSKPEDISRPLSSADKGRQREATRVDRPAERLAFPAPSPGSGQERPGGDPHVPPQLRQPTAPPLEPEPHGQPPHRPPERPPQRPPSSSEPTQGVPSAHRSIPNISVVGNRNDVVADLQLH